MRIDDGKAEFEFCAVQFALFFLALQLYATQIAAIWAKLHQSRQWQWHVIT